VRSAKCVLHTMSDVYSSHKSSVKDAFTRYKAAALPRPSNSTPPSISFTSLSGPYRNLGYGEMELCFFFNYSTESQSDACKALVKEQPLILPGAVKEDVPTFIAHWNKSWSSHLKLEHFDGNLFNLTALDSRVRRIFHFSSY